MSLKLFMFHKLVLKSGDSRLEWFNQAAQNYGSWCPVPVKYRTFLCMENFILFLSLFHIYMVIEVSVTNTLSDTSVSLVVIVFRLID